MQGREIVIECGAYTPVCMGIAQSAQPKVSVRDADFGNDMLFYAFWSADNPRVIAGETWCDVSHIAPELCDIACAAVGWITLEADGLEKTFTVTCACRHAAIGGAV